MFYFEPIREPAKKELQERNDCNLMAVSNLTGIPRFLLGPRMGTGDEIETCHWFEDLRQRLVCLGFFCEWLDPECDKCMRRWQESPVGVAVLDFGERFKPNRYHAVVVKDGEIWFDSAEDRPDPGGYTWAFYIRVYRLVPENPSVVDR